MNCYIRAHGDDPIAMFDVFDFKNSLPFEDTGKSYLAKTFERAMTSFIGNCSRRGPRILRIMRSNSILLILVAAVGCANHAPDPAMSPELRAFLVAEDLDDIQDARGKIKSVTATDAEAIHTILKQWHEAQAVSNLLIHADLIPQDERLAWLFRGLEERTVDYYVLAAIVGLGEIDRAKLPEQYRKRLAQTLLAIIRETKDVRALRASVSLQDFVSAGDAPQVIALMEHSDRTVRGNLRSWLFKIFENRGIDAFTAAARQSILAEEAQGRLVAEFKEYLSIPDQQARRSKLVVLYAFIPNLKDYVPREAGDHREKK